MGGIMPMADPTVCMHTMQYDRQIALIYKILQLKMPVLQQHCLQ